MKQPSRDGWDNPMNWKETRIEYDILQLKFVEII